MASYADLTARFPYKGLVLWSDLDQLAQNDDWLKANGWPTGTETIFFQAAAPTGWTRDVTAALEGRMLRVVSGSGGVNGGGAIDFSSSITLAHITHTITSEAAHTHNVGNHTHTVVQSGAVLNALSLSKLLIDTTGNGGDIRRSNGTGGGNTLSGVQGVTQNPTGSSTTSSGSHDHGGVVASSALSNITLQFANVLLCTKATSSGFTSQSGVLYPSEKIDKDPFVIFAADDAFNFARLTPSGTAYMFAQVSAPTGWTKQVTVNNYGLRAVASGTGGATGGSAGFGSTITLAHTHTITAAGSHSHSDFHIHLMALTSSGNRNAVDGYYGITGSQVKFYDGTATGGNALQAKTDSASGGTTSTDPNHDHGGSVVSALTDTTLAYIDVIYCTKDSTGAGSVYTDMTSGQFVFKQLVSKQRLNFLAQNDAYVKYHTVPSGSVAFFYQGSAPSGWTKLTTTNDKALRVVSGSTGGTTGGVTAVSAGLTLAHTHVINVYTHHHTMGHTHNFATAFNSNKGVVTAEWAEFSIGDGRIFSFSTVAPATDTVCDGTFDNQTVIYSDFTHSHGGATGSALTNISWAYADVIMCQKN